LQQLVINLFMNAVEAIGDEEGSISISTNIETLAIGKIKGTYLKKYLYPGKYIILEISDTGCGIDKATSEKIFAPFFTTKFVGHGLGLSTVLGIAHEANAAIEYQSKVGQGTVFNIYFPSS